MSEEEGKLEPLNPMGQEPEGGAAELDSGPLGEIQAWDSGVGQEAGPDREVEPRHESDADGWDAAAAEETRQAVEGALTAFDPDIVILDRHLELPSGSHRGGGLPSATKEDAASDLGSEWIIDWVVSNGKGEVAFVIALDEDDPTGPSVGDLVLEVLQRGREQWPFIQAHLGEAAARTDGPRLILIAPRFQDATVGKLAVFGMDLLQLLEVHEVRSESASTLHLQLRWPENPEVEPVDPNAFLDRLHQDLRELAMELMERLQHVDERLVVLGTGEERLEWSLLKQPVCRLEQTSGGLQGRIEGSLPQVLTDDKATDVFLEGVLRRYFDVLAKDEESDTGSPSESLVQQGLGVVLTDAEMNAFF